MKKTTIILGLMLSISSALFAQNTFTLSSSSLGGQATVTEEFNGFGCNGSNLSPQLSWTGAPKGTVAFAILLHDPDAPTGSGWWHWQVINIPSDINSLKTGAGDVAKNLLPKGSVMIENDYGFKGFGGACPPEGNGIHHYNFTIHALSKKLDLPKNASGALTGYNVKANSIASATITALYKREKAK